MSVMYSSQNAIHITKKGTFDKRQKLSLVLEQKIEDFVVKTLKENNVPPKSNKPIAPRVPKKEKEPDTAKWLVSVVGKTMTALQALSAGIRVSNAVASGDEAKVSRTLFSGGVSAATLLIGTFGGPYGMVAATILNYVRGMVGQHIENQIQETYDTRRYQYRLSNYDISKYSTQTYNAQSQKWISIDAQRANLAILKTTNIS